MSQRMAFMADPYPTTEIQEMLLGRFISVYDSLFSASCFPLKLITVKGTRLHLFCTIISFQVTTTVYGCCSEKLSYLETNSKKQIQTSKVLE